MGFHLLGFFTSYELDEIPRKFHLGLVASYNGAKRFMKSHIIQCGTIGYLHIQSYYSYYSSCYPIISLFIPNIIQNRVGHMKTLSEIYATKAYAPQQLFESVKLVFQ